MACTTDPGAVPMGARPIPANLAAESDSIITERDNVRGGLRRRRGIRRCRKCNDNYKPARAHHDSVTGRCVVKMDHYCPWVGNAVGIMNHKFFILFVMYTFLTSIVSLTLILIRVIRCEYYIPPGTAESSEMEEKHHCNSHHTMIIFILGIITILFFFFTFCMLLEQTEAIHTNMSKIARMKTRAGMVSHPNEYAPVATEFNEVFGGEHPSLSFHWLLPLKVKFPEWALDNIMGYEWDVTFDASPYQENTDGESSSYASSLSHIYSADGTTSEYESGMSAGTSTAGSASDSGSGQQQTGGMDVETGNALGEVPDQRAFEQEMNPDDQSADGGGGSDSMLRNRSSGSFT